MAGRGRLRRKLVVNEKTAFAYVRCGLPDEWEEYYLSLETRYPSRSTKNRWFYDQWNCVRRFARKNGIDLRRRFFDPEGSPRKLHDPLPLPRRRQLAALYLAVQRLGVRKVLVDDRCRLDSDEAVQSLLVEAFRQAGVTIIEASTGFTLSEVLPRDEVLTTCGPDRSRTARRQVALWKAMAARLKNQSGLGRRPFGALPDEAPALARIRELYRVLPKSQWRTRKGVVQKRRSFAEIAAILNGEEVPTRTGRAWSARTVHGILDRLGLIPGRKPRQ
jgi:hypothetical protein